MMDDRLDQAIRAFREGRAVVLQDDPDREDEGDLIMPAELISEAVMALMIRDCSGIVCLCLEDGLARRLDLPQMVARNENNHGTAFTVTIEAREGSPPGSRPTTGWPRSAPRSGPGAARDLARPGHVFPCGPTRAGSRPGAGTPRARWNWPAWPACARRPCCASS